MNLLRLTIAIALTLPSWTNSQEWTRFRGPNGSGEGTISGLPDEVRAVDYEWAIKIQGEGHSSPVLWGNKVFITVSGNQKDTVERKVLCFDSTNGKLLWQWNDPLEKHNLHKFNNFAASTPTVDQDRVYLVWGSGSTTQAVALSHSGGLIWRKEWPGFSSDHGQGSSPILINNVLVFHTDAKDDYKSYVIGLTTSNGDILWELERVTPASDKKHFTAYNTPNTVTFGDIETVVALQSNDGWKGINPIDGSVVWSVPGSYSFRSVGSVASANGYLFATFGAGGAGKQASTIKIDNGEAKIIYSLGIKDGLSYVPSPLIHEGRLYLWGDGGILTCRNLETGKMIYRERIGGNFFSSPILADGKIICGSLDGELLIVEASKNFKILGRSHLRGGMRATPAIANGCLFIRTDKHLMCVKGK